MKALQHLEAVKKFSILRKGYEPISLYVDSERVSPVEGYNHFYQFDGSVLSHDLEHNCWVVWSTYKKDKHLQTTFNY